MNIILDLIKKYIKVIITAIITLILGFILGDANKKQAEDKAYKKGCIDTSIVYEKKLKIQTEEFLNKEKNFEKNKREYDGLLNLYEIEIEKLQNKTKKKDEEIEELHFLIAKYNKLLGLSE